MTISIRKIFTFLTGMSISATALAQHHIPTDWSVVAEIPAGSMQSKQPGLAGGISGVFQQVLIIAGGSNFPDSLPWQGGKKKYHDDIFVLDLDNNDTYKWMNAVPDKLPQALAYSACTSTPNGVISIGGENEKGLVSSAYLIGWDMGIKKCIITSLPDFPFPVTNAAAAYATGKVYVAGGETAGGVSRGFYALSLNAVEKGWQKLPDLPSATSHTLLLAQAGDENGQLFLIGGRRKDPSGVSELYDQVFAFAPHSGTWIRKSSLPYPLSAGTGVCVDKKDLFIFGGDKGETFHQVELLMSEIVHEHDPLKKQQLTDRKNDLQVHHPGFSHELLTYRIKRDKWKRAGKLDFTIPVTTNASIRDHKIFIAGGEIRAGVRTAQVVAGIIH